MSSSSDDDVIETGARSADEPEELDPETAALRADDLGLKSRHELDERQERLRPRRRWGGPDLEAATDEPDQLSEDVPDVTPTETAEGENTPA